jgi:hypothetical protein
MVSGLIIEDPMTKKIFGNNPVFIYKTDKEKKQVDKKIDSIQRKYPDITMERFDTTVNLRSSFAPNVIGGITRGFSYGAGAILGKIDAKMKKKEEEDEVVEVRPPSKRVRSHSPPLASVRAIGAPARRSNSK